MTCPLPTLSLKKGTRALFEGRIVKIVSILDLSLAAVRDVATEKVEQARIEDLLPPPDTSGETKPASILTTDEATLTATQRREIIEDLINKPGRTRADVEERAKEFGWSPASLYNWIRIAEEGESLSRKERKDKGKTWFGDVVEALIAETFDELTALDRSAKKIWENVKEKIENANAVAQAVFEKEEPDASTNPPKPLRKPSLKTVKNRLRPISARKKIERERGQQAAQQLYDPILGSLPNADFPLAVVQIDHVLLDIMLVDDVTRKPIRRPWLTIALDVCSRMVTGYDYSLDPPGEMATGICIARSILPKEGLLKALGSTGEWPVWGKPTAIHGDNAFRLRMLKKFCQDVRNQIDLIWRPVRNPRFGGHVERLARTLGEKIHFLPGTTLKDLKARGIYDSEAKATFTVSEFEQWLVERILLYHAERHSALGMSPMACYKRGVLKGTATRPPTGLQSRIVDEAAQRRLELDLMPYKDRTVQRYGVLIDNIHYWHDCLRRWINSEDPEHPKLKRKFIFRRFKRGLRSVWFLDPELDEYFEIPTKNPSFPEMSIWELQAIKADAKAENGDDFEVDEQYIIQRHRRMRELEAKATKDTKASRTREQRERGWRNAPRPKPAPTPPPDPDLPEDEEYAPLKGFTEDD